MQPETLGGFIVRLSAIESDLVALRTTLDREELAVSDRQYLKRCFELLAMELSAIRQYVAGLSNG